MVAADETHPVGEELPVSLRYNVLRQKPAIFKAMSGLSVALFDELVWELEPASAEATVTRRTRPHAGGGSGSSVPLVSARRVWGSR